VRTVVRVLDQPRSPCVRFLGVEGDAADSRRLAITCSTVQQQRSTTKTAWVPFLQEIGWEDRANAAAVAWTEAECRGRGVRGLLLVYSHANNYDDGSLGAFAKRHSITTQRSSYHTNSPRSSVVIVDRPDEVLMETAVEMGRGALCAIESPAFPLLGWAMESRAEDLLTGELTPETRTEEQRKLLDFLKIAGNNGWHDSYAEMRVPSLLNRLQASGLGLDVICGVMLARGATASGIQKLQRLTTKV
jgi:hypothetical protein